MKTLKEYMKCEGCRQEIYECYAYQYLGDNAGLEESNNGKHIFFFVIDPKTNKFIVPFYNYIDKSSKESK